MNWIDQQQKNKENITNKNHYKRKHFAISNNLQAPAAKMRDRTDDTQNMNGKTANIPEHQSKQECHLTLVTQRSSESASTA
jgi:hypothetical protein